MKRHILYILAALWGLSLSAQSTEKVFEDFRKAAGDHSAIYTGKVSYIYIQQKYADLPYWETDEYRTGTLSFEGRVYTNVLLRYDPFRKDLNIVSPQSQVNVVVNPLKIDYFILNGIRFVPNNQGDYLLMLHETPYLTLTSQLKCTAGVEEIRDNASFRTFVTKEQFTLTINGISHEVNKRNSFIKCFPTYKKQLKKYAKENQLDFSEHKREAFIALARYTETLIKADRHEK